MVTQHGSKHHYWSLGAVFVFKLLLYKALFWNCGKILLSGTCPSSKDPSGKKNFWLQIFKIWVSSEVKSGSEPLFDLQEALGMTSNMAIFAVFRRRNGSKLKLPDPVFPPHLGVPNFFWCFWNIFMAISNGQNCDTPVSPFWSLKVTVVLTMLFASFWNSLVKFLCEHMIHVLMDEKYLLDLLGRRSTEKWSMYQDWNQSRNHWGPAVWQESFLPLDMTTIWTSKRSSSLQVLRWSGWGSSCSHFQNHWSSRTKIGPWHSSETSWRLPRFW